MGVVVPRWPFEGVAITVAIAGGWCCSRLFTLASRCELPLERLMVSWATGAPARFNAEPSRSSSSSVSSSVQSELRLLLRLRLSRFPFESWPRSTAAPFDVLLFPFAEGNWRLAKPPREAFVLKPISIGRVRFWFHLVFVFELILVFSIC